MKNFRSFRWFSCILAAFIILFTGIESAHAATINVTANATDTLNGDDGQCSLREAITNINDGATTYTDCVPTGAYGTSDTINIPAGTYTTTTTSYNIANNVSIVGAGAGTTTINGNSLDRVFVIGAYTVSISGITITGGNTAAYGGGIAADGGGILTNGSVLTVTNSIISGNTSTFQGGGIETIGGVLNVTNSTISGNHAYKAGGIFNWLSTVTVTNSTISGNTSIEAPQAGGIYSYGWLTVTNSTISGNTGGTGGGINSYGTATVTNSTISGNSAGTGGGIANMDGGDVAHSLTVTNSTISGNSATTGGGIYNQVTATLSNSIVANQTEGADCVGAVTSGGHNLESASSCEFTGTGDLQHTNPLLGALAGNGGPTQTMALQPGSPAIDAGDNAICAAAPVNGVDQRSYSRPAGATCDIGAYELAASCVTPPRFGLVALWSGENNANDSIGSNHGTLHGGTTYAAGRYGQAFSFDGVDDYVDVGTSDAFNFNGGAGDFTLQAWIKMDSVHAFGSAIVGKATHGPEGIFSGPYSGWAFYLYSDGRLAFGGAGVWEFTSSVNTIIAGNWYHVAVTKNAGTYKLYSNGQEVASTNHGNLETSVASLLIGSSYIESVFFDGLIDDVAIYNRALSAAEVQAQEEAADTTPENFTFSPVISAQPSAAYESNSVTVTGINGASPISISGGGEYQINGGAWTAASGNVSADDLVKARLTSSGNYDTTKTAVITIGGVSAIFSVTTLPSAALIPDLIAYYPFNGNVDDASGNGHNGTAYGAALTTDRFGNVANAYSFNGTNQYIDTSLVLNNYSTVTVSLWVKLQGNAGGTPAGIISNHGANVNSNDFWLSVLPNSPTIYISGFNQSGTLYRNGILVPGGSFDASGNWEHISFTVRVNGSFGGFPMLLGLHEYGAPGGSTPYFNGLIDDVRVYGRALTPAEMAALSTMVPNSFSFSPQTAAALNLAAESNAVTVTGISCPAPVSITGVGAEYSILLSGGSNWSAWTASVGMVNTGDMVKVRQTSSAGFSTTTNAVLTIGSVSGTFSVTTVAMKGDINNDEAVTLADAILALQITGGMNPLDIRNNYASSGADANDDGKIGLEEAIYILQRLAGLRQTITAAPIDYSTYGSYFYVVPAGITSINVKMWGAGGMFSGAGNGGAGGYVGGTIATTPGETLTLLVARAPFYTVGHPDSEWRTGGFGGGGNGGGGANYGMGGGGASRILRGSTILMVAAGGGGGGNGGAQGTTCVGGAGGGTTGAQGGDAGTGSGGGGGTQTAGGAGGIGYDVDGVAGSFGQGGNGNPTGNEGGGGGGGGYYGGGGGGGDTGTSYNGTGGGGGSSYTHPTDVTSAFNLAGSGTIPGNSSDTDLGTAGTGGLLQGMINPGDGKIFLY